MELRHLRYFVAVAEDENVSRAALKLHVSQPGISRQIHDLEDEIGFLLFERSGKSVRLTVAGKIFLGEARDILQRTADAVRKASRGPRISDGNQRRLCAVWNGGDFAARLAGFQEELSWGARYPA